MKKIIAFHLLFIGIISNSLFAQDNTDGDVIKIDATAIKDSLIVPGNLFNLNKYTSTGAVAYATGETLKQYPSPSITNSLYGRFPGLTVSQGTGEPGNDVANLAIRGVGSSAISSLYNNFNVFVDGFEVKLNYFNYLQPEEIESISILKDAATLAQFGMHGDNGVIWIVTKRGVPGRTKFTFQTHTGVQTPITLLKPLRSYDFAKYYNVANSNDNKGVWKPNYSPAALQAYDSGKGIDVDWYNQVLRNAGAYSDGTLTFNGGDNKILFNTIINYTNQQGLINIRNTDTTANESFARINLRTNLNFKVLKIFDARVGIVTRLENRKAPSYSDTTLFSNFSRDMFNTLANYPSNIYQVMDSLGGYYGNSQYLFNPRGQIAAQGWKSTRTRFLQGNFGLREKLDFITKGLYIDESLSFNSMSLATNADTRDYARTNYNNANFIGTTYYPAGQTATGQDDWKQGKLVLGYDHQFGVSHHLTSAIEYLASTELIASTVFNYKNNFTNTCGNTNYSYKNKYIADFAFSYFGSDNFAPSQRYVFYPAISAAWVASEENFVRKALPFANFLKLRASAGLSGNDANVASFTQAQGGYYLFQQFYSGSGSFYQGGDNVGSSPTSAGDLNPMYVADPNFSAEKSKKYDIGTDITIFNKFSINADFYIDYRSNIPSLNNFIPGYYGNVTTYSNVGAMTSKGLEIMLSYSNKIKDVDYTVFGITSLNTSNVTVSGATPVPFSANSAVGRPFGTPLGLVANGLYQLSDFNPDGTLKSSLPRPAYGNVQPGDIKYKDLTGDGVVDARDIAPIGKTGLPTMNYSFGANLVYKHFDLGFLLQGAANSSVNLLNTPSSMFQPYVNNNNAFPNAKQAWAYYPSQGIDTRATATMPRLSRGSNINNTQPSSFWYKNNSFFRVRNIELGYKLGNRYLSRYGLSEFRCYLNCTNPFTFSHFMQVYQLDPESLSGYPSIKTVSLGLSVAF